MNSASTGFVNVPSAEETGSIRSTVPVRIKTRKLIAITLTGESPLIFFLIFKNGFITVLLNNFPDALILLNASGGNLHILNRLDSQNVKVHMDKPLCQQAQRKP